VGNIYIIIVYNCAHYFQNHASITHKNKKTNKENAKAI